jgi:hypothetical protein
MVMVLDLMERSIEVLERFEGIFAVEERDT